MVYKSPEFERLNKARMQELVQNIRELANANHQLQRSRDALASRVAGATSSD